jgi:hypothetical protein
MTITAADIKLLASERMSDASDGGGRMTANAIVSGEMNNIFPKVSRTDAVYGRVNLRKIYAAVQTANLDMYGGAHAIVADAPDDTKINCALFATGSAFDTRAEARNRIESYVVAAGLSRMRIYGNQIEGAKALTVYQRVEEPLPESGEVFCLSVEADGYTPATQFVRITDMEHEVRVFTDGTVDFERRVIILSLSSPLTQTFPGAEPVRSTDASPTRLRSTTVADASKYYGIQPVTDTVAINALECTVGSIYGALVPSTNRETPISLAEIAGASVMRESGAQIAGTVLRYYLQATYPWVITLPTGIKPGTLATSDGYYVDDGDGNLIYTGTSAQAGTVDYEAGALTFTSNIWTSAYKYFNYTPTVQTAQASHTRAVEVTLATRGTVYVETLTPLPGRGAVFVDYRALGRWYRLQDNGNGELVADAPSIGVGSVDYVTGAVVVTLGALPDIDSSVIFSWGSVAHTTLRANASADTGGYLYYRFQIPEAHLPLADASTITLAGTLANNVAVTFSVASGATAITSSYAQFSGTVDRNTGVIEIKLAQSTTSYPLKLNSTLTANYTTLTDDGSALRSFAIDTIVDNSATLGSGIAAGSINGTLNVHHPNTGYFLMNFEDDGAGNLIIPVGAHYYGFNLDESIIGAINYTTGAATFEASFIASAEYYDYTAGTDGDTDGAWTSGATTVTIVPNSSVSISYSAAPAVPASGANSTVFDVTECRLQLNRSSAQPLLSGSVMFVFCGLAFYDVDGALAYLAANATNTPGNGGTIDYNAGIASLSYWPDATGAASSVISCLTRHYAEHTGRTFKFRTAGSPLRAASVYVQAHTPSGTLLSGTTDTNGYLTGTGIIAGEISRVNQPMGVVSVQFNADVLPSSVRYNCVVISNLPLDPTLLGLDPVRLPQDGRVPIFRPGDIVVLHHTDTTTLPNPVTPGNSYSLGRTDLASVSLADSLGAPVLDAEWSADLAAGTVTIDAGALLTGLTEPLIATHRIEQMNLATDVQVSGMVSFSAPITREFPSGSLLSSALAFGDLVARVSNVFDQATWTGVWSDTLIGSQATAQYNDIAYPLEVLNNGAITERWRINFTSATAFTVIGENTGQVATGTTSSDVSVSNPLTGEPYFTLRAAGWGSGWATGNQLRFNTHGANAPIWIARTVLGGATLDGDAFTVEMRGDTD